MARIGLDASQFDKLQNAIKDYPGNAEKIINDVLHNEASPLIQEKIRQFMPVSGADWKGKATAAKTGNSLTDEKGNLSITVKTTKKYQYLYFPDDGTNTKNHAGNQQFFLRGAETQQNEIVNRCLTRLINGFEQSI